MPVVNAARPNARPVLLAFVLLAAALAALRLVPPYTLALLPPVVVAGEASPLVAVFAAVLAAFALGKRPRRPGLAVVALLAAAVASVPWLEARSAARAGDAAIAALRVPPPVAIVAPTTSGSAARPRADERLVRYAAADGIPLVGRLFPSARPGPRPTLVVLYGGAWQTGDAEQSAALHRRLAAAGYTVVALDYRHAPAYRSPAQRDDAARGLALVRDSARAWGVDLARLVLWGRSSGAQLAMLAAWTDSARGVPPVRAVVDYYGPVDLPEGYAHPPRPDPIDARAVLRAYLGGTPAEAGARYRDASPLAHVRPGLPPTLLLYGGRDHLVEPRFGRTLAHVLAAAGDPVAYVELPWAEHGFDVATGGVGERVATALTEQFLMRVTVP